MTGHIRRRGKKWAVVVPLGKEEGTGKKQYKWFSGYRTKKEAEADCTRILNSLQTGTFVEPAKLTVSAFLDRWVADYARANVGATTLQRYLDLIEHNIKPALGKYALARLQPLHVQSFYTAMLTNGRKNGKGGLSPATVVQAHRVLRKSLADGVRWQLVGRNVCDAVTPPKVKRPEVQTIDDTEAAALLDVAAGTPLYLPVLLGFTLGARRGEVLALRWCDLDLMARVASICRSVEETRNHVGFKAPKSGKGRVVALPAFLLDELQAHREAQNRYRAAFGGDYQENDLVCAREDGSLWKPSRFSQQFEDLAVKANLDIRLHDLRHSHATQLLRDGVHPKVVSERLGHSSIAITMDLYSHVGMSLQAEAASKVHEGLTAARAKRKRPSELPP